MLNVVRSSNPLIESVRNEIDGSAILTKKFGAALKMLVRRAGVRDVESLVSAVMAATVQAIRNDEIQSDEDLPQFIRQTYRQLLDRCANISKPALAAMSTQAVADIQERLKIFTSPQREALHRFYVNAEGAEQICHDLHMQPEQFSFIRQVAREAIRGVMPETWATKDILSLVSAVTACQ